MYLNDTCRKVKGKQQNFNFNEFEEVNLNTEGFEEYHEDYLKYLKETNEVIEKMEIEKPKTKLEITAAGIAVAEAVEKTIEKKKAQYQIAMEQYMDNEHQLITLKERVKELEKEQKDTETKLSITKTQKQSLF